MTATIPVGRNPVAFAERPGYVTNHAAKAACNSTPPKVIIFQGRITMKTYVAALRILLGLAVATAAPATLSAGSSPGASRSLYAVNEAASDRGSISVYDIDAGHRLVKKISTVRGVADVRGVVASAVTGKLYVAYVDVSGVGMIYCLDIYNDGIVWNKAVSPGVDRLAANPDGRLLYVPTWENNSADFINVVDAASGDVLRKVFFSNRSHDTLYPLSGPIFQETKAGDGSGRYLYMIDPHSYAVSRIGPYSDVLGPYSVDGVSNYVVNNVTNLWGMQIANLKSGQIMTVIIPDHPAGDPALMHGIGWTPDETEVWQSGRLDEPHVYIWDMRNPMAPVLKDRLTLRAHGAHWVTFDIKGDYAYVAPPKNSDDGTEVFNIHTHSSTAVIGSSEDMLEIDFAGGEVSLVGDQYGIGRRENSVKKAQLAPAEK
jgi:hypothetical protein